MKTFSQFIKAINEDAGSGYSADYEIERKERKTKTPIEKRQDKDLKKLSYMLNLNLPN